MEHHDIPDGTKALEVVPGHRFLTPGKRLQGVWYKPLACWRIWDLHGHPLGLLLPMYVKEVETC